MLQGRGAWVMNGPCCRGSARRRAGFTASILPGAMLMLLPKCPLCLAAWLGLVTGVGVSAVAATYVRGAMAMLCVAGLAFVSCLALRNFVLSKGSLRSRLPWRRRSSAYISKAESATEGIDNRRGRAIGH
jgi:hypothetical protein